MSRPRNLLLIGTVMALPAGCSSTGSGEYVKPVTVMTKSHEAEKRAEITDIIGTVIKQLCPVVQTGGAVSKADLLADTALYPYFGDTSYRLNLGDGKVAFAVSEKKLNDRPIAEKCGALVLLQFGSEQLRIDYEKTLNEKEPNSVRNYTVYSMSRTPTKFGVPDVPLTQVQLGANSYDTGAAIGHPVVPGDENSIQLDFVNVDGIYPTPVETLERVVRGVEDGLREAILPLQ